MKKQLLQIPKSRGFKSLNPNNKAVSVKSINTSFKDGDVVSPSSLLEKHLISRLNTPVKILGKEKLTVKVKFENIKMSDSVKKQLES